MNLKITPWYTFTLLLFLVIPFSYSAPVPEFYPEQYLCHSTIEQNQQAWIEPLQVVKTLEESGQTEAILSSYESLIEQNVENKDALAVLIPLYWHQAERSDNVQRMWQFFLKLTSYSNVFIAPLAVVNHLMLQASSSDESTFVQESQQPIEQPFVDLFATEEKLSEAEYSLRVWLQAVLTLYDSRGGLSVADKWLLQKEDQTTCQSRMTLYRKLIHGLVGQSFPQPETSCWPLACAEGMSLNEMEERAQWAYDAYSNDGYGKAWQYLKGGVQCLYNVQANPQGYSLNICYQIFNNLAGLLQLISTNLSRNGGNGWQEYNYIVEIYQGTFGFQNRVSNQLQRAYEDRKSQIELIEDPEVYYQASATLLNSPIADFSSSSSRQQAVFQNQQNLNAVREAKAKKAATEQAFQRINARINQLYQQLEQDVNNENLWLQLLQALDSSDAQTGLSPESREKLKQDAAKNLETAKSTNYQNQLFREYQTKRAEIIAKYESDPVGAREDFLALLNGEHGQSLKPEYREQLEQQLTVELSNIREDQRLGKLFEEFQTKEKEIFTRTDLSLIEAEEAYLALLNSEYGEGLAPEYLAEEIEAARLEIQRLKMQKVVDEASQRAKSQLEKVYKEIDAGKSDEEHWLLIQEILNTEDAQVGIVAKHREIIAAQVIEQVSRIKKKQHLDTLYAEFEKREQDIQQRYDEDPIGAREEYLALLNGEHGESLSAEYLAESVAETTEALEALRPQFDNSSTPDSAASETDTNGLFTTLETIGRGEDFISQGVEWATESAIRISYETFPEETEKVLDVLSRVDQSIGVVVEFLDDSTGNKVSTQWEKLDETTQARILGLGRVLSVVVPVIEG